VAESLPAVHIVKRKEAIKAADEASRNLGGEFLVVWDVALEKEILLPSAVQSPGGKLVRTRIRGGFSVVRAIDLEGTYNAQDVVYSTTENEEAELVRQRERAIGGMIDEPTN